MCMSQALLAGQDNERVYWGTVSNILHVVMSSTEA
jgi:hypothetical protein